MILFWSCCKGSLSTTLLRSVAALGSTDLPKGTFPNIQAQGCTFHDDLNPVWGMRRRTLCVHTFSLLRGQPCSSLPLPDRAKPIQQLPQPPASGSWGYWCLVWAVLPRTHVPAQGTKMNAGVPGSPGHLRWTGGGPRGGPGPPCHHCPVPFKGERADRKFLNG